MNLVTHWGYFLFFFADDSRHPSRTTFKLFEGDFYFPSRKVIRKRGFALTRIARAQLMSGIDFVGGSLNAQ